MTCKGQSFRFPIIPHQINGCLGQSIVTKDFQKNKDLQNMPQTKYASMVARCNQWVTKDKQ